MRYRHYRRHCRGVKCGRYDAHMASLPSRMQAMVYTGPGRPLEARELPLPQPASGQVLLRVHACGVCRTDLHLVDGELPHPTPNVIPGHEIVGTVAALGPGVGA